MYTPIRTTAIPARFSMQRHSAPDASTWCRDVRPLAPHRRARRGSGWPVRVGRRCARVPRVDESVVARIHRGCPCRSPRMRPPSAAPRTTRRATASCAPRRRCSPIIPAPRTSAIPTSTARTNSCRASGWSCAGSSTAASASSSPTTASRCITTATPRTSRTRCSSRSSSPTPPPGKIFNVGDEEVLSIRQVIELIATALDRPLEIVSMPYELAIPARPLLAQPLPTHRVLDITRVRHDLGYRDVVPARAAIAATARWLVEHPCARRPGGARAHRSVRLRRRGSAHRRLARERCAPPTRVRDDARIRPRVQRPRWRPRSNEEFDA